jgi:plasmid stabilization system protein ParE
MGERFVPASSAALDLFEIWEYIKEQASVTTADKVESAIRDRIAFLAESPRPDTTAKI